MAKYVKEINSQQVYAGLIGRGITSQVLLSTVGVNKTYRITYTDETTFDYVVKDGNSFTYFGYSDIYYPRLAGDGNNYYVTVGDPEILDATYGITLDPSYIAGRTEIYVSADFNVNKTVVINLNCSPLSVAIPITIHLSLFNITAGCQLTFNGIDVNFRASILTNRGNDVSPTYLITEPTTINGISSQTYTFTGAGDSVQRIMQLTITTTADGLYLIQ